MICSCYSRFNKIRELPVFIVEAEALDELEVLGNPIVWPPMEICMEGLAATRSFMQTSLEKQIDRRNTLAGAKVNRKSV